MFFPFVFVSLPGKGAQKGILQLAVEFGENLREFSRGLGGNNILASFDDRKQACAVGLVHVPDFHCVSVQGPGFGQGFCDAVEGVAPPYREFIGRESGEELNSVHLARSTSSRPSVSRSWPRGVS